MISRWPKVGGGGEIKLMVAPEKIIVQPYCIV